HGFFRIGFVGMRRRVTGREQYRGQQQAGDVGDGVLVLSLHAGPPGTILDIGRCRRSARAAGSAWAGTVTLLLRPQKLWRARCARGAKLCTFVPIEIRQTLAYSPLCFP